MSEVTEMPQVMLGSNGNLKPEAPAGRQRKTSSTVDLRKMSQMHEAMVQKIEVRHVDITEELANIEKNNETKEDEDEKKE